jgi:DNA polymerase I-like protein with 3'-5' exonuclease and polymerase domains
VIHCCVVNDEVFYDAYALNEFLSDFNLEYTLVGHNIIGYDQPFLKRLWGCDLSKFNIIDTLVLSRLANPSRDGGHSLASWGERLGFPKGDYSDWTKLTPEMVTYCKQDVKVTTKLLEHLKKELAGFSDASAVLEFDTQRVIAEQINNGWLLDQRQAYDLLAELKEKKNDLEAEVQVVFKPLPTFIKEVVPKVNKDGSLSVVGLKFLGLDYLKNVEGAFSRVDYPQFNLGSRQQIGRWLQHFGWKPQQFTEKGTPVVDETILEEVTGIPEATLIAQYLMLQKRIAQVQSWIEAVNPDTGRVHGYVNSNGAVTGRMTHSSPNLAQVPAGYSPYGKECRSCWIVPKGFSLVGCDASGLELRMLAHYMNDSDYTNLLLNADVHTANQLAAGLETRDQAKTFIYAFLYGAGDAKIGSIVGGNAKVGKVLKERFLSNTPALAKLKADVAQAAARGYLKGLDGRKIWIRSPHAALNSLLQGAGAVVMKKALTELDVYSKLWGIERKFVGNIHDEIQTEVITPKAHVFGRLAVSCIQAAGIHFDLNCPLDGDYKVGLNWAETH